MECEQIISGCIKHRSALVTDTPYGEYVIRDKYGQGWGIPIKNITPEDLRAMANHLEAQRDSKK